MGPGGSISDKALFFKSFFGSFIFCAGFFLGNLNADK